MKIISDILTAIEAEQLQVAEGAMRSPLSTENLHITIGTYRGLAQARDIIEGLLRQEDDKQADL